jgi:hypothetical protein
MPNNKLDFDSVREIAIKLGADEESTIHGAPSIKVRGKLFACPALHKSADPGSIVVRVDPDKRAELISENPDAYYITKHYANYPMVLVRLLQLNRQSLQGLLEKAWEFSSAKAGRSIRRSPPKSATRKKKAKS